MSFPKPADFEQGVVIYLTEFCPYCVMAKRLLERKGVVYATYDVGSSPEARRWLVEQSGQRTVPQIFVGGQSVGGYQELAMLDRSGELDRALASADA